MTSSPLGNVLIAAVPLLILLHAFHLWRQKRWFLFEPLNAFWAGVAICYIQQPITYGDVFMELHGESVFVKTMTAVCIGMLFVVVGYELNTGQRLSRLVPRLPAKLISWRTLVVGIILVVTGLFGYAYLFESAGGAREWLATGRGGTDYENISGYGALLAELLPAGVLVLFFRANTRRLSLVGAAVSWLLVALMWLWFLYLGTRSRLIGFTILSLAMYYLPRRKNPAMMLLFSLLLGMFILTNFQQNYRENFTNLSFNLEQINREEMWQSILPRFLGGKPETAPENISLGIEINCVMSVVKFVPDVVPYNYGYGFLEFFTRPIPRAIWPEKRYPMMESLQGVFREADLTTATVRDSDLLMGPVFTFVGHWYYVGGFVGLVVGGLITGVLFRAIRCLFERSVTSEGDLLVYPFMISLGFIDAAGTPFNWVFSLPFLIVPMVLLLLLCADKHPHSCTEVERR